MGILDSPKATICLGLVKVLCCVSCVRGFSHGGSGIVRLIYLIQREKRGDAVQVNSRRCFSCLLMGGVSWLFCEYVAHKDQSHPGMGFQVDLKPLSIVKCRSKVAHLKLTAK